MSTDGSDSGWKPQRWLECVVGKWSLARTAVGGPGMALVDIYNQGTNKTTW